MKRHARILRHRQPKGAETDTASLQRIDRALLYICAEFA